MHDVISENSDNRWKQKIWFTVGIQIHYMYVSKIPTVINFYGEKNNLLIFDKGKLFK